MKTTLFITALLLAACGSEAEPVPLLGNGTSDGTVGGAGGIGGSGTSGAGGGAPLAGTTGSGGAAELPNPLGHYRCTLPPGANGSPATIEQAMTLLNALPKPTSVACFVEALDRPLRIFATNSIFSAQPALNTRSPRVFIQTGHLWSSIVIDGEASELLEFGGLIPGTMRSIKGELHLPLTAPAGPNVPYERVRFEEGGVGTSCGLCHFDERAEPVTGVSNAFSSIAFRPRADSYVSVESLRLEAQTCSWQSEPQRCELLAAVFGGGAVVETSFPDTMDTFF